MNILLQNDLVISLLLFFIFFHDGEEKRIRRINIRDLEQKRKEIEGEKLEIIGVMKK